MRITFGGQRAVENQRWRPREGARHGSILPITLAERERLLERFPSEEPRPHAEETTS